MSDLTTDLEVARTFYARAATDLAFMTVNRDEWQALAQELAGAWDDFRATEGKGANINNRLRLGAAIRRGDAAFAKLREKEERSG